MLKSLKHELLSADEAIENSRTGIELLERDSKIVFKILFRKILNVLYLKFILMMKRHT